MEKKIKLPGEKEQESFSVGLARALRQSLADFALGGMLPTGIISYKGAKGREARALRDALKSKKLAVDTISEPFFGSGRVSLETAPYVKKMVAAEPNARIRQLVEEIRSNPERLKRELGPLFDSYMKLDNYGQAEMIYDLARKGNTPATDLFIGRHSYQFEPGSVPRQPTTGPKAVSKEGLGRQIDKLSPLMQKLELYDDWKKAFIADPKTLTFVDPPYLETKSYINKFNEHGELAAAIEEAQKKGSGVVYNSPMWFEKHRPEATRFSTRKGEQTETFGKLRELLQILLGD